MTGNPKRTRRSGWVAITLAVAIASAVTLPASATNSTAGAHGKPEPTVISFTATQTPAEAGGDDFSFAISVTGDCGLSTCAAPPDSGTVTVDDNGVVYGAPAPVRDGAAVVSSTQQAISPGPASFAATYSGTKHWLTSSAAQAIQVDGSTPEATDTTFTEQLGPAYGGGDVVTFDVAVAPDCGSSSECPTPNGGSVDVTVDGNDYGSETVSNGQATLSGPMPPFDGTAPGRHTVTASYSGAADYGTSSTTRSIRVVQVYGHQETATIGSVAQQKTKRGARLSVDVLVQPVCAGSGPCSEPPHGTVSALIDGKRFGAKQVTPKRSEITIARHRVFPPGHYTLTVAYKGFQNKVGTWEPSKSSSPFKTHKAKS